MTHKHYHIALLIRKAAGINTNQMQAVAAMARSHCTALGTDWRLALWIPTHSSKTAKETWPDDYRTLAALMQCDVESLISHDATAAAIYQDIKAYDEVWCLGGVSSPALGKSRVARIYAMSQQEHLVAPRFKWIASTVENHNYTKKGKR